MPAAPVRIVALEEHFTVPDLLSAWRDLPEDRRTPTGGEGELARRLRDLGEGRIAAMDDQGVDVAVLSLSSPGV